jgi:hypothetical protein
MRDLEKIVAGSQVYIAYETRDQLVVPSALFDPDTVEITIYDPAMNKIVDGDEMTRESEGRYSYVYQTTDDPATYGTWFSSVMITRGSNPSSTNRSKAEAVFILEDPNDA